MSKVNQDKDCKQAGKNVPRGNDPDIGAIETG